MFIDPFADLWLAYHTSIAAAFEWFWMILEAALGETLLDTVL